MTISDQRLTSHEMSIRLFHKNDRFVVRLPERDGCHCWLAFHTRRVKWDEIFAPALMLVGFPCVRAGEALQFDGRLDWTSGTFWTTIRLRLPPCSPKKATLLAAGLFKAARYADGSRRDTSPNP
jgi:hypothetical protein